MAAHSSILIHRESHGQRSLVGYSPWGCKESDTTEQLSLSVYKLKKSQRRRWTGKKKVVTIDGDILNLEKTSE